MFTATTTGYHWLGSIYYICILKLFNGITEYGSIEDPHDNDVLEFRCSSFTGYYPGWK